MSDQLEIIEEKNVIDDHLLDIIGNEFKFSHEKGLSEWLKNAADAYLRAEKDDSESHIYFRFINDDELNFECIDFVGMTSIDINNALKRWGDPEAAKRGTGKRVFGGHGNGGKFYMRQMFDHSHFITYRNGKLNVFGFGKSKRYGFAKGYKDKVIAPENAMKFSGIHEIDLPPNIRKDIMGGRTGFTVVRGIKPDGIQRRKFNPVKLCEKFRNFPQSRQILKYKQVSVIFDDSVLYQSLSPELITPLVGFEKPVIVELPTELVWNEDGEVQKVSFANDVYPNGTLGLYTSAEPLSRNSRLEDLNRIDIIGEIGAIASYKLRELGYVNHLIASEFIYGECECKILESPDDDCVKNDRSTLVENKKTKALRQWISQQVDMLAEKIEEKEKKELRAKNMETLGEINKILNDWKNMFMSTVMREILGGPGDGAGAGFGTGGHGGLSAGDGGGHSSSKKNSGGDGDKEGGGSTAERKSKQTFPIVLLSNRDDDPLNPGSKVILIDRQPPVYQRPEDVPAGIYWINTARKLSQHIIDQYGVKSMKWRDYHLQRVIDVICKEALYKLEKNDPENFTAASVDGGIIDQLVGKAHDSAIGILGNYMFEDEYKTPREELLDKMSGLRSLTKSDKEQLIKDIEEAMDVHKE